MRILILFCLFFSSLFAHKLNIFLAEEGEKVVVNSYFASGAFCKNCKVEIYNLNNVLIKEAKTDDKGEYILDKPKESLSIKVEAIGGHAVKAKYETDNKLPKSKIEKKSMSDSLIQSFIAILLIVGIFFLLKRTRR